MASGGPLRCRFCIESVPPFAWALHLAVYDGSLKTHLHKLKFENRRTIARPLGSLLGDAIKRSRRVGRMVVVVPIPLHARRLHERGYNQAALIGQALADVVHRPLLDNVLVRHKETQAQARLTVRERRKNVQGAFAVVHPSEVRGRDVILVDDVFTTGSTCRAAALALLRSGASSVAVACTAIAVSDLDLAPQNVP